EPIPQMVDDIRIEQKKSCAKFGYEVIDAQTTVTGRDFLLKIWHSIASAPLSVAVVHEDIPKLTQENIFYELGVAQAMGKETVVIKSPNAEVPSDFVRSEYITFNHAFSAKFDAYLQSLFVFAEYCETIADQLDRDPIMALDYLKRAFLINGDQRLQTKAHDIAGAAGLESRAANSVEMLAANF
ncbi:MAG: hypothetical protein VCD66_05250, partial [Alphaproteobacteria bacterium]